MKHRLCRWRDRGDGRHELRTEGGRVLGGVADCSGVLPWQPWTWAARGFCGSAGTLAEAQRRIGEIVTARGWVVR